MKKEDTDHFVEESEVFIAEKVRHIEEYTHAFKLMKNDEGVWIPTNENYDPNDEEYSDTFGLFCNDCGNYIEEDNPEDHFRTDHWEEI